MFILCQDQKLYFQKQKEKEQEKLKPTSSIYIPFYIDQAGDHSQVWKAWGVEYPSIHGKPKTTILRQHGLLSHEEALYVYRYSCLTKEFLKCLPHEDLLKIINDNVWNPKETKDFIKEDFVPDFFVPNPFKSNKKPSHPIKKTPFQTIIYNLDTLPGGLDYFHMNTNSFTQVGKDWLMSSGSYEIKSKNPSDQPYYIRIIFQKSVETQKIKEEEPNIKTEY